jgi:hypothetical protein
MERRKHKPLKAKCKWTDSVGKGEERGEQRL